jgi:hypothetical protein
MHWAQGDHIGSYDDATGFGGEVTIPGARFLAKMAVGADGFLYVADSDPNSGGWSDLIWRIDPVTLTGTALRTPTPNSLPWGITSGADGNIWFTEAWSWLDGSASSNKIGMIDVAGGTYAITEFATPRANSLPRGIIPGPVQTDPDSVWFIEYNTGYFGRIDLATHAITEYFAGDTFANSLGGDSGLGLATDGINLFFSEYAAVGGFDPVTQQDFGNFTTPERRDPEGMTLAADGQLYLTERNDGELLRFDPVAMQFTGEAPLPGLPSDPFLLAAGPGAPSGFPDVWLTNPFDHRVDRYEIDGMPLESGQSPRQPNLGVFEALALFQEGPRVVDSSANPQASAPPVRPAQETDVLPAAGSANDQVTDAFFARSHDTNRSAPWDVWRVGLMELDLVPVPTV